jgi:hypothetical protein
VVLGILIDYSFFWHQNLIPLYLLIVLSFTPCGDGCSTESPLETLVAEPFRKSGRRAAGHGTSVGL